ncbi:probable LRR receptor-like serine/threonine-protein kinase At3g47570 [Neltuma alba]|uniref:probable LRR receptor-like serine/threonine-protein kinase At3g47570 n=1 Tax=Neltuma alba TaxID=207710 RepID=UPI0010A31BBA|nr:probable LRR receptor-like serine/threonine-protein kinase At3g47570 [Prosopis alba]
MPSIREFSLGINQLSGTLPEDLYYGLPLLEVFAVVSNQLEGNIPKSISNCTFMKGLYMGGNFFTGSIPKDIGNPDKLEQLDFSANHLSGHIPSNIFNISAIQRLYLGFNFFSGLLPSYLGSGLPNLKDFSVEVNELSGQIPKSIVNASKLYKLFLNGNKFNGEVYNVIGNLTNLVALYVGANDLNGLIPPTVNKLQSLQLFDVSNNKMQGSIVEELCQVKRLNVLYLANNMFSGTIPRCLENLSSLQRLDFSSNKLTSYIPSSLWNLKNIFVLDLSSNAISGRIPPEVSKLRSVIQLNLSRNQITGNIPITIGGLQSLQNLSLAHNNLQGSIPESFGDMLSIEFLDLSQNYLSGEIPKSLESLSHLKYINLSYNLLHGEIPYGGPFKNFRAESFVMNKDLCGKPQLGVHPCIIREKHRSAKMMLLIKYLLPIVVAIILVGSCIVFVKCRKHQVGERTKRDFLNLDPGRISYYELLQGTNRFDESNLLGKGSFGSVYQAILSSGKIVALKVFSLDLEEALRSFDVECTMLCNLRHRNLIKIISSCSDNDFKSLIMEFMPNGSLNRWLYSYNYCLDILQRLDIMIDVASALEYLHHGSSSPVVHCDVKPSNVLLDNDMVAHLSDFGIAKLLGFGQSEIFTKTLATFGYMAPEYGSKGAVSVKGDVYSFGILLMETLTRKKPTDEMFGEGLNLKDWVGESIPHSIISILDDNLLDRHNPNIGNILPHISSIFELALNCCIDVPEARPDMTDIGASLEKIRSHLCKVLGTSH